MDALPRISADMVESVMEEAKEYERQQIIRDAHDHISKDDVIADINKLVLHIRNTRPRPSESDCRRIVPDLSIKYPSLFLMVHKNPYNFTTGQTGLRDIMMMLNVRESISAGAITADAADKVITETFFEDKCADTLRALQAQQPPAK